MFPTKRLGKVRSGGKRESKVEIWDEARRFLLAQYRASGITSCEFPGCGSKYFLSFHHLDKRSSGKAKHTFDGTRLVCAKHHDLCEYNKSENSRLAKVR